MATTSGSPGFWHSLRQLPGRTPLWGKLITAVLTLVAIALVVISIAGIGFLKSYLLGQADNDLYAISSGGHNQSAVQASIATGTPVTTPAGSAVYWLPSRGRLEQLSTVPYGLRGVSGVTTPGPQITAGASWLTNGNPTTVSATSGSGRWQVLAVRTQVPTGNGVLQNGTVIYGWDVTSVYQTTAKLVGIDWIVSAVLLLVLALVGVAVIRASLRPLGDIEQTAGAIAAGDLSRRVPERDPRTEIGRLGRSLNVMLSQIESAFMARSRSEAAARRSEERMRQFVADASHELRTPLTAIRGFAEYYRQRGGVAPAGSGAGSKATDAGTGIVRNGQLASADLDRIMRRVEQESARMGVLVEDMLLLARLDQQRPLDRTTVDLLTLAADAVHDARVVAPNRNINLTVGAGAALLVIGDEVRLRQVIGNLMSNALAHTPDGTAIDVRIRSGTVAEIRAATAAAAERRAAELKSETADTEPPADEAEPAGLAEEKPGVWPGTPAGLELDSTDGANAQSAAVLEVTDYGPGLTEAQAAHAFERFYRADQARTAGGTGLGLAIVAALVAAHGGAVWVQSDYGNGATFSIALPLAPEAVRGPGEHEDEQVGDVADEDQAEDGPDDTAPGTAWMGSAAGGSAHGTA
jgi:two-component system, OmpR family, sensor kinase